MGKRGSKVAKRSFSGQGGPPLVASISILCSKLGSVTTASSASFNNSLGKEKLGGTSAQYSPQLDGVPVGGGVEAELCPPY